MDQINLEHSKMCAKHPKKQIEFVQVTDIQKNQPNDCLFCCTACIYKELALKGNNYLLISEIIEESESNIIQKWPPINDYSIIDRLIQTSEELGSSYSVIYQINLYFTQLKDEFQKKIDLCEKKMINKALELQLGKESVLKKYQEISQILQLKTILTESEQKSAESYESRYREFITQMDSEKDRNTQLLANLIQQSSEKQQLINFQYPNEVKNSIITFIDEIDFFNSNSILRDNNYLQPIDYNTNQSKLMKLISNKSNYCTSSFLTQLQTLFERTKSLLTNISFDNIHEQNKQPIDFSGISDIKLKMIEEYVQHSIKIEQNKQSIQSIEQSQEIKQLSEIFESSFSFMSNNVKIQLKEYFIDTYPFLKKVDFSNTLNDRQKFDCFRQLKVGDIKDLFDLLKIKQELTEDNKLHLSQTNSIQQPSENQYQLYQNGQQLLCSSLNKYPIFDSIQLEKQQIAIKLIKSNYNEGNLRIIINDNHEVSFNQYYSGLKTYKSFTCVSNEILDENNKYIFRFRIQELKYQQACVHLGLVENNIYQHEQGTQSSLSCGFYINNYQTEIEFLGINQYLKNGGFKFGQDFEIEVRVWRGGKQLEILDYPNYLTHIAVDNNFKEKLINSNNLRLYLGMSDTSKQLKVTLTSSFKVDSFPN